MTITLTGAALVNYRRQEMSAARMMHEYFRRLKEAGIRCGEGADWDAVYPADKEQSDKVAEIWKEVFQCGG